jgi:hypothetical protein
MCYSVCVRGSGASIVDSVVCAACDVFVRIRMLLYSEYCC